MTRRVANPTQIRFYVILRCRKQFLKKLYILATPCLIANARALQRAAQRVTLLRLRLPRQTAARRDLGGNGDHPPRQAGLGEQLFRRQRLSGGVEGDDQRRLLLPGQGRMTFVACICFSTMTYMLVTSPTRSFSVKP